MMAEKFFTPYIPKLDKVNVPPCTQQNDSFVNTGYIALSLFTFSWYNKVKIMKWIIYKIPFPSFFLIHMQGYIELKKDMVRPLP